MAKFLYEKVLVETTYRILKGETAEEAYAQHHKFPIKYMNFGKGITKITNLDTFEVTYITEGDR